MHDEKRIQTCDSGMISWLTATYSSIAFLGRGVLVGVNSWKHVDEKARCDSQRLRVVSLNPRRDVMVLLVLVPDLALWKWHLTAELLATLASEQTAPPKFRFDSRSHSQLEVFKNSVEL